MALTFIGTGGLFSKLGSLFQFLRLINTHEANTLAVFPSGTIQPQYLSTLQSVIAPLLNNVPNYLNSAEQPAGDIQTAANQTILQAVQADTPAAAATLTTALANVVYQMTQQSYYVSPCNITAASSIYPTSGLNNGDGQIVLTPKRGDGLTQQNAVAEVAPIVCTLDGQTGNATAGQEQFTFAGAKNAGNPYSYLWPTGSGATATLNAISASSNAGTGPAGAGNLLVNGGFDAFTSGVPNNWTVDAGAAGTDYGAGGGPPVAYQGANCLALIGGGSVLQSLTQQFNNATLGSGVILQPNTTYVISFWAKWTTAPAAGTVQIEFAGGATYGSGIIHDSQNVADTFSFNQASFTTSWQHYSCTFRTPRVIPAFLGLRILTTTLISAGSSLLIDNMAMAMPTQLYPGGPGAVIFSGMVPFINGDGWKATTTNDRAGQTFAGTFQACFDRFFGMRAAGLLLPTTGTTLIPDTLI